MNTTLLKNYAPAARRAFIAAVTAQAGRLGITAKETAPSRAEGDVLLVAGNAFPKSVAEGRKRLAERVRSQGFDATMEAIAYTWFNRLVALRYMELHGYLDHGYRVLSHADGQGRPEILDHAADVDLPGLDGARAVELKLDGTKDEELYRLLLKAQCDALNKAMPFLFEKLGDETELLLPANLLHTDSLIRQLVEQVDEGLWQEIEIIGWLYQFYISEKKDQVIGKVVASKDIPAATQLFTPNWIVKYMVQNSLGAQWLATYPQSPLKGQMEYYIEPARQSDEVNAKLAAITPNQLNPEELTLIDPACGSGHILVEAYGLFKAIYLERGYRQRDVPQLILEKNLFGLDIDERAAQLTGFALMMQGRADDRRLFDRGVKLNVMALVDSAGFDAVTLGKEVALSDYGLQLGDLTQLKRLFEHATTFGSLIQVPEVLTEKLPALKQLSEATSQDIFVSEALNRLGPLVHQAELLGAPYDEVVANPPYMGLKKMNPVLKQFARNQYGRSKGDLYAMFMDRAFQTARANGRIALVTMHAWMFLPTFEDFRNELLSTKIINSLAHLGPRAFAQISGEVVQTVAFSLLNQGSPPFRPSFFRLVDGDERDKCDALRERRNRYAEHAESEFLRIPGAPLAYWLSYQSLRTWADATQVGEVATFRAGLQTGDNDLFLRLWHEVSINRFTPGCVSREVAGASGSTWFPHNKGGGYRRWYGLCEYVINWRNDGQDIKRKKAVDLEAGRITPNNSKCWNQDYYFRPGLTWSSLSNSIALRKNGAGFLFDTKGQMLFPESPRDTDALLGLMNSTVASHLLSALAPTLDFNGGTVAKLPFQLVDVSANTSQLVSLARRDWDTFESSWDFRGLGLLSVGSEATGTLESSYAAWTVQIREVIAEMQRLEEENNRVLIDAYDLAADLVPDVPIEQITLTVNPAYRYGRRVTEEEHWTRFRQDSMEELVSYAIGCMMGRYSLDEPGLIYAHSGNYGFNPSRYATFPAADDGIVPLTDTEWFKDDACNRVVEFVETAWPAEHLEKNLAFLASNLGPKKNESSRETIRRWLCDKFFKDHHLKGYKKRPIYWLFSSGKHKAFQCLVYLHRCNEGTLARMRGEYVVPLQGKMFARIEKLEEDIPVASSTAHRKRLEKELAKLRKQEVELIAFDEKLRHYADRRIHLDLDDGVKVNYGKFGDLLAEVYAIHGRVPEAQ